MPDPPRVVNVDSFVNKRDQHSVVGRGSPGRRTVLRSISSGDYDAMQGCVHVEIGADLDDHLKQLLHLVAGRQ